MFKKGFTLAEVLITLGIIGVVATLTLPNVMSGYAKKSQVAQLQRTVNALSSAASQYLLDNHADALNETSFTSSMQTFFEKYLGAVYTGTDVNSAMPGTFKAVGSGNTSSARYLPSTFGGGSIYSPYCGKLATGATVCIDSNFTSVSGEVAYRVLADVNANATPNTYGRDVFSFFLTASGRIKGAGTGYESQCSTGKAYYCFTKIMLDGWEMNY